MGTVLQTWLSLTLHEIGQEACKQMWRYKLAVSGGFTTLANMRPREDEGQKGDSDLEDAIVASTSVSGAKVMRLRLRRKCAFPCLHSVLR